MKRTIRIAATAFVSLLFLSICARTALAAPAYVMITDVSQLKYQMTSNGVVYFRNLNTFDASLTGCCYSFYLDTTTPYGRSAWATILAKMAARESLWLHVTDSNPTNGNPALVDQLGNW